MTRADDLLGVAPPTSIDGVLAGLTRLRRDYQTDDEDRQSRGSASTQVEIARLKLLDSLIEWIRPAAEAEWAAADRELQLSKERTS